MKTLVLGAEGMLGSVLLNMIPNAIGATRRTTSGPKMLAYVDIADPYSVREALKWSGASTVVNCAGIVKSECDKHSPERVLDVNANAPHTLAKITFDAGVYLIHISTDCVFNGTRVDGPYTEDSPTDAEDLYGRSKAAGELINYAHCATLRTSFIGRDRIYKRGLLEWLLAQDQLEISGYTRAFWSGLSTYELARAIRLAVRLNEGYVRHAQGERLQGLYHVAGPTITKAALLRLLCAAFGLKRVVQDTDEPYINRALTGTKFNAETGYTPSSWAQMAKELVDA